MLKYLHIKNKNIIFATNYFDIGDLGFECNNQGCETIDYI